jgi:hypothetical protein
MARLDGGKLNLDKRRQTHFFKQTASIAQAALGAALGAGGMNGMDAANLMAGFATAALNSNGGGGGSGRGGGGGLFERGASWATSRLGALVGGGAPHQNQQQPGEGSPGGAFDGAAGGGNRPGAYSRGGGLLSLLTPSGGAAALSVSPSYCRAKLLLLSAPWLRRWPYSRVREPQSVASTGGPTIYAPPARDVHAPDLYIPAMALATLAVLRGAAEVFSTHESASAPSSLSALSRGNQGVHSFSPETISGAVSGLATAWALNGAALKAALWALGSGAAAAVPLAELAAYAGYPLFHGAAVCAVRGAASLASSSSTPYAPATPASLSSSVATANTILNKLGSGSASGATGAARWAGDAAVLWGGCAAGVFLVRSLKRVLFHDVSRGGGGQQQQQAAYGGVDGFGGDVNFGYGGGGTPSQSQSSSTSSRSNYVLLLLWFAQFPLVAWLARGCRVVS